MYYIRIYLHIIHQDERAESQKHKNQDTVDDEDDEEE